MAQRSSFASPVTAFPSLVSFLAASLLANLATAAPPPLREAIPTPLTEAEQKELSTVCKRVVAAYAKAVKTSTAHGYLGDVTDALQRVLESPPRLKAHGDECLALFGRETRRYVIDTLGVEARSGFRMFSTSLSTTLEETGKLCPSSRTPVPRNLPHFYAPLTAIDWSDPAWGCMHVDGVIDHSSIQFETVTDEANHTVTFVARGAPFSFERVVEWEQRCTAQQAKLTCGDVTLR